MIPHKVIINVKITGEMYCLNNAGEVSPRPLNRDKQSRLLMFDAESNVEANKILTDKINELINKIGEDENGKT
jgi:hypothetical protein